MILIRQTGTYNKDSSVYTRISLNLYGLWSHRKMMYPMTERLPLSPAPMNRADQNYGGYGTTALHS